RIVSVWGFRLWISGVSGFGCGCLCCADLVADTELLFIIWVWNERQKLPEQRQKLPERGAC
ncbi:MAG: hypothetical protein ACKPJJ_34735, partial [Planctomycetaceae bacterium]